MRLTDDKPGLVLNVREAAAYLNISTATLYRMLIGYRFDRDICPPSFKIGNRWRFNLEDLNEWRRAQPTVMQAPPPPADIEPRKKSV